MIRKKMRKIIEQLLLTFLYAKKKASKKTYPAYVSKNNSNCEM